MTSYEHYANVATFIKDGWSDNPVFMLGEVIDIKPPFLVLKTFSINNESTQDGQKREDIKGFTILCYESHRGKLEKLTSDVLDKFSMANVSQEINIGDIEQGITHKLQDDLFESALNFTTRSIYAR